MDEKIKKRFYDETLRRTGKPPSGERMRDLERGMREMSKKTEGRAEGNIKEFMDSPFMKPVEEWEKRDRDGSRGKWRYHGVGKFKN